jgi:hypothetical protein
LATIGSTPAIRFPSSSITTDQLAVASLNPKATKSERLGNFVAGVVTADALIEAIVMEMSDGIECAVNFWMDQIERALHDPRLTTLGRMHAVLEIVKHYRSTGELKADHHGHAA